MCMKAWRGKEDRGVTTAMPLPRPTPSTSPPPPPPPEAVGSAWRSGLVQYSLRCLIIMCYWFYISSCQYKNIFIFCVSYENTFDISYFSYVVKCKVPNRKVIKVILVYSTRINISLQPLQLTCVCKVYTLENHWIVQPPPPPPPLAWFRSSARGRAAPPPGRRTRTAGKTVALLPSEDQLFHWGPKRLYGLAFFNRSFKTTYMFWLVITVQLLLC